FIQCRIMECKVKTNEHESGSYFKVLLLVWLLIRMCATDEGKSLKATPSFTKGIRNSSATKTRRH
ncbi:MAG: hypothetical protein KAV87_62640, partial [Desulfobacteraceae bacterium]|nr:hypothetical protein [Desulfobacteraceae bacterium]